MQNSNGPERVRTARRRYATQKALYTVLAVLDKALDVVTTITGVICFGCLAGAGFGVGLAIVTGIL